MCHASLRTGFQVLRNPSKCHLAYAIPASESGNGISRANWLAKLPLFSISGTDWKSASMNKVKGQLRMISELNLGATYVHKHTHVDLCVPTHTRARMLASPAPTHTHMQWGLQARTHFVAYFEIFNIGWHSGILMWTSTPMPEWERTLEVHTDSEERLRRGGNSLSFLCTGCSSGFLLSFPLYTDLTLRHSFLPLGLLQALATWIPSATTAAQRLQHTALLQAYPGAWAPRERTFLNPWSSHTLGLL